MLDLGDDVLIAIGSVSAQWATLEYYMSRVSHSCCAQYSNKPSKLSASMAFGDRRNAFLEAFNWENVPEDLRQSARDFAGRIEAVENNRHKIIHGMANEAPDHGDEEIPGATSDKIISFLRDHPKHYFAERLTVAQITDIAREIQGINDDMVKLYLSLWLSGHGGV